MQRPLLIIFTSLSISIGVSAQEVEFPKRFLSQVDIVAGCGFSFLYGSDRVGSNEFQKRHLKFSYAFGLEFFHVVNRQLSLSALPIYERKGVVYTVDGLFFNEANQTYETRTARYEHSFDNYTLPLLANFKLGSHSKVRLSTGPFVSYLAKQVVHSRGPAGTRGRSDETRFNKKLEAGLVLRTAYIIPVNAHVILTPIITNHYGLTGIRKGRQNFSTKSNVTYFLLAITLKQ